MAGTITHQWNGTILTISSDSGTSACDLKGAKGDDGPRGPQGVPGDANLIDAVAAAEKAAADAETALSQLGTARDEAVAAADKATAIVAGNEAYTKAESDSRFAYAIKPTVSGDIAAITDAAALPTVAVVSGIEPIQEGSGEPSSDNVRAISGIDSVKVYRTGKNVMSINSITTSQSIAGLVDIGYLESGTYTLSADITKYADDTATNTRMTVMVNYIDGHGDSFNTSFDYQNLERDGITRKKELSFTIYHDKKVKQIIAYMLDYSEATTRNAKAENIQIEYGTTATAYEPYNGTTLTATLPQTIYGGMLNLNTGVLTITHDKYILSNNDNMYAPPVSSTIYRYAYLLPKNSTSFRNGTHISDSIKFNEEVYWDTLDNSGFCIDGNILYIRFGSNSGMTTVEAMAAYLENNPMTFVYQLAEPQTIQLTPQQLETLKGVNNVWSSTGGTTLTYIADTQLYIDNKINELSTALVAMGG